jgi:hypothetical protein
VDPVPDALLLRNVVVPRIEPGTSESVDKNYDQWTTEAAINMSLNLKKSSCPCGKEMAL